MSSKRSKGEGNVRKLPSGNWFAQVMDGYHDNGKRKTVSFTAGTRGEVLDKLRRYHDDKNDPSKRIAPKISFSQFAEQWYQSYRTQVEASTYANYYYTLKLLKNQFGETPISNIKTMEINGFMNKLEETNYSYSQINKCRAMLIQIFDAAESDDLIAKNYVRHAFRAGKRALHQKSATVKDAFTQDEMRIMFEHLPGDLLGNSIRLLLVTGLRIQDECVIIAQTQ